MLTSGEEKVRNASQVWVVGSSGCWTKKSPHEQFSPNKFRSPGVGRRPCGSVSKSYSPSPVKFRSHQIHSMNPHHFKSPRADSSGACASRSAPEDETHLLESLMPSQSTLHHGASPWKGLLADDCTGSSLFSELFTGNADLSGTSPVSGTLFGRSPLGGSSRYLSAAFGPRQTSAQSGVSGCTTTFASPPPSALSGSLDDMLLFSPPPSNLSSLRPGARRLNFDLGSPVAQRPARRTGVVPAAGGGAPIGAHPPVLGGSNDPSWNQDSTMLHNANHANWDVTDHHQHNHEDTMMYSSLELGCMQFSSPSGKHPQQQHHHHQQQHMQPLRTIHPQQPALLQPVNQRPPAARFHLQLSKKGISASEQIRSTARAKMSELSQTENRESSQGRSPPQAGSGGSHSTGSSDDSPDGRSSRPRRRLSLRRKRCSPGGGGTESKTVIRVQNRRITSADQVFVPKSKFKDVGTADFLPDVAMEPTHPLYPLVTNASLTQIRAREGLRSALLREECRKTVRPLTCSNMSMSDQARAVLTGQDLKVEPVSTA